MNTAMQRITSFVLVLFAALRTVSSSVRYTEYSNVGHDVWTRAFRERDLEWMFAQRRR